MGAGLARDDRTAVYLIDRIAWNREQARSHKIGAMPVGAGLARDGRPAVCLTDRGASIAGKPAPTRSAQFLWEPGLPAMAAPRYA